MPLTASLKDKGGNGRVGEEEIWGREGGVEVREGGGKRDSNWLRVRGDGGEGRGGGDKELVADFLRCLSMRSASSSLFSGSPMVSEMPVE